jgi:hypothetical protein
MNGATHIRISGWRAGAVRSCGGLLLSVAILLSLSQHAAPAQTLDGENKITITLEDGTPVTLYGKAVTLSPNYSGEYYYLPVGLRLSTKLDGATPEFLFLKYTTERGDAEGAIMHFLMEWGLTPAQERELQTKLVEKLRDLAGTNRKYAALRNPRVMGAAMLRSDTQESFRIISATLGDKGFAPSVVTSGRAPLMPGAKIAVASRLDKNGAQLLAATFEKGRSITDVSMDLHFRYDILMPAVDGRITVNWTQVSEEFRKYTRHRTQRDVDDGTLPKNNSLGDDIINDTEKDSIFSRLTESKAVKIELDNLRPDDPSVQKVVGAFMDYFLQSIAEKQFAKPETKAAKDEAGTKYNPPDGLYEYKVDQTRFEKRVQSRQETYNLKMRLPVTQDWTLTENLASWYDGVKSNAACVAAVNLNDPFFQHRDINLILDLEGEEMFGTEANYVTVNVRKKRDAGNDFSDRVVIDREYLKAKGVKATMTYARGTDTNPDLYEYQAQWSFRGGRVYPESAPWVKGEWAGITLAPPIKPRKIEFEGNPEEMKAMKITRATLQVRYQKLGREMETNIPFSVAKGEPLTSATIYLDRETKGYACRLIFDHTEKGKLALDWKPETSDYVYASIPEEFRDVTSALIDKAVEAGRTILSPGPDGVATDKVLDKFKEVLGIVR